MVETAATDDEDVLGPETGPTRLCVATRRALPVDELVRFVASPDGAIVTDVAGRLPGRGVWVSCDRAQVAAAVKSKAFARSLKRPVVVAPELADQVEVLLRQRALAALAICNKAGALVLGFVKIEKAVAAGDVRCLLHAAEAASDGARKLDRKLMAVAAELGFEPCFIRWLAEAEMSLATGRANVIHAALKPGGAALAFLREAGRSARYRSGETSETAGRAGSAQRTMDTGRV